MSRFNTSKHGYDIDEVDKYLDSLILKYEDKLAEQRKRMIDLKNDLTTTQKELDDYAVKDKQIAKALMVAVEKAEEIERNAYKIYDLELRRIEVLYSAWKEVIEELEDIKVVQGNEYLKEMLSIFHTSLDKALSVKASKENINKNENYIRAVLEKMRELIIEKEETEVPPLKFTEEDEEYDKIAAEDRKEKNRLSSISKHLNNVVKKSLDIKGKSGELYEKGSAYEKSFVRKKEEDKPSENGFDLNEILHPKEDLEEIMKAFDFANSKKNT